jgi:hypothetical protein
MTRYITNEEQDKLDEAQREAFETEQVRRDWLQAAQARIDRERDAEFDRLHGRARLLTAAMVAVLALTAFAIGGWYLGGAP